MGIFVRFLGKGRTPILSFMCLSIAILLVGCNKPKSISESSSDSPKSNLAELKYLVVDGSPHNRGLVHGKTLKKEIRESVPLSQTPIRPDPDILFCQKRLLLVSVYIPTAPSAVKLISFPFTVCPDDSRTKAKDSKRRSSNGVPETASLLSCLESEPSS